MVGAALLAAAFFLGCASAGGEHPTGSTTAATATGVRRISGADVPSFAANVALRVFPSDVAAHRPKAVTLVGEEWQNAIAAAVLMAHPIRAPLLIASAAGPAEPSNRALAILNPQGVTYKPDGNRRTDGPQAYAIGPVATPAMDSTRTAETSGAPQAAEIATLRESIFREPPRHIVIVSGDAGAFAAPAAAWTARSGDPVLYTHRDELPRATRRALRAHPEVPVYVLGPPAVVSSEVLDAIRRTSRRVKRIAGRTPAENAVAFARYADGDFGWGADAPGRSFVIARSNAALEAALASPLSASAMPGPLLLTESAAALAPVVREYLTDVRPVKRIWIVGDEEAVGPSQASEIERFAETGKR